MDWLVATDHRRLTPNRHPAGNVQLVRPLECVVLHYTGGYSATSSVKWLCDPQAQASAHLVVERDGVVWQLAPFSDRCWHAGSRAPGAGWRGRGTNAISVGVEIANLGILHRKGGGWIDSWGKAYGGPVHPNSLPLSGDLYSAEIRRQRADLGLPNVEDTHGAPYLEIGWEPYPSAQVAAVEGALLALAEAFPVLRLDDEGTPRVCGHSDVDPTRKIDPGPALPLERLRCAVQGVA